MNIKVKVVVRGNSGGFIEFLYDGDKYDAILDKDNVLGIYTSVDDRRDIHVAMFNEWVYWCFVDDDGKVVGQ